MPLLFWKGRSRRRTLRCLRRNCAHSWWNRLWIGLHWAHIRVNYTMHAPQGRNLHSCQTCITAQCAFLDTQWARVFFFFSYDAALRKMIFFFFLLEVNCLPWYFIQYAWPFKSCWGWGWRAEVQNEHKFLAQKNSFVRANTMGWKGTQRGSMN